MNPAQRYERAFELFHQACDLPVEQLPAFLDEACGDDADLRREVETLLRHDAESCDAMEQAEAGQGVRALSVAYHAANDAIPERIGAFRVVRKIGQGGMGAVYEAEQDHPKRSVALKMLHVGPGVADTFKRFQREANLLGRLKHPGIAHVYEAGVGDVEQTGGVVSRQPYFAMELVDGEPLDTYARQHNLSDEARLKLFASVCDAVQHAHERGVVHRDLKPSNILVTTNGFPKVLDFGVSRATNADVHTVSLRTLEGQLVGTIPYMSPEQVMGDPGAIDERSDVYALGVVLFELLVGRLPQDLKGLPIPEAARRIREDDPTLISTVERRLRGDVETIVGKALEKDIARRYQSAAALGADIRRFLAHEAVVARPASAIYVLRKFARRNKGLVAGLIATFVVLVLGTIGTTIGLVSALRANEQLEATNETLAETIRALEETNTNLQNVSEFQSSQLTGIDVPLMGVHLRAVLLDAVGDDRRAALESQLAGINFIDVARTTLKQDFLGRTIDAIDSRFPNQPLLHARLLQDVAATMRELGILNSATAPQARALEIRRRELGDEHAATITSINQAGMLDQKLSDFSGAEALYREALEINRRIHGDAAPQTLTSLANVGAVLRIQGELETAEIFLRDAMNGLQEAAGPNDPQTLDAMSMLAAVLSSKGEFKEAEQLSREALKRQRETLGDEDPATLALIGNFSNLLESAGKYEESAALSQEVYETRRRVLGDEHPDTLASMTELGARLYRQGKYRQAEPLLREALAKRRQLLGDDHYDTLSSIDHLAALLDRQGSYGEAEKYYRESYERYRRTLGNDHPATLRATGNLGFILKLQDKAEEAEPLYRAALAGLRDTYGNDHPNTLTSVGNLATLLTRLGKDAEAEPLYHESLAGRRRLLGEDHPSTLNAIYNMGNLYLGQGNLEAAEPYCRQALDGYRRVGGDDHIGTLFSLTNLGRLRMAQQRPAEAESLFQEAVERRRRINGDNHAQTWVAAEGLADALETQERWSDAEPWRRFMHEVAAWAEPADPARLAKHLGALGRNLLHQEKSEEAESIIRECLAIYDSSGPADDWDRWAAHSLLGEAIAADPSRYAEAENLLLEVANMPATGERERRIVADAEHRLAKLYDAWEKPQDAAQWRGRRDEPKVEPQY